MSGLFGSTTIKGNRLTDLSVQTSTVGKPIPFGLGRVRVEEANVIWTAGIPKEHRKKKKQGKGGVKTEEYTYSLSYAIAFMRGPVNSFITIKRGGKVVYTTDPNAPVEDRNYAAKWKQKARFYLGTETQMPDATIEAYVGAGKVSAFRGLCYIVLVDDDVTAEGGAVPQYEAVIQASDPDAFVTSETYTPSGSDAEVMTLRPAGGELRTLLREGFAPEAQDVDIVPAAGELRGSVLRRVTQDAQVATIAPSGGQLRAVSVTSAPQREAETLSITPAGGTLKTALITHGPSQEAEAFTITPSGGSLQ